MRKTIIASLLLITGTVGYTWWSHYQLHENNSVNKSNYWSLDGGAAEAQEPAAVPSATVSPTIGHRSIAWSVIESKLIRGSSVDANEQQRLISADATHFRSAMDSLETEMLTNPVAREFGKDYRELLTDHLRLAQGQSALHLERFACSGQLCIAQLSGDDAAWNNFVSSLSTAGREEFPAGTRAIYSYHDPATGNMNHRLIFTSNPQITGFRVRVPKST